MGHHFALLPILAAVTAIFALPPSSVDAHAWEVDDGCGPGLSANGMFYAGGPDWTIFVGSGYGGCHMATQNSGTFPSEYAEWYLPSQSVPTPSNYNHNYDVYTILQNNYCSGGALTGTAHYHRWRNGHDGGITSHVVKSQDERCYGSPWLLHTGYFCNANGGFWDMQDNTFEPTNHFILVDYVLFNPRTPTHTC